MSVLGWHPVPTPCCSLRDSLLDSSQVILHRRDTVRATSSAAFRVIEKENPAMSEDT